MTQAVANPSLAVLTPESLNTMISLAFAPLTVLASITTLVVGFNAFVALATFTDMPDVVARMDQAITYGIARGFVASIVPAGLRRL